MNEILSDTSHIKPTVFDKTAESWHSIQSFIQPVIDESFPDGLLGVSNDLPPTYDSIESAFMSPDSVAIVLEDTSSKEVVGFSFAFPIGRMDTARTSESETAYLYYTHITPAFRGKKLVNRLTDTVLESLHQKGYSFVERDAVIEGGYADAIKKNYGDSIIASREHNDYPEFGLQRWYRVDIEKYLSQRTYLPQE